jgi:hypothetical protein
MPRFSTLGPRSSNHDFVLRRYLAAHGLRADVALFANFHAGALALADGKADFMLQCAAHPDTAWVTGAFRTALFVVDAFISPSQPMALVRHRAPTGGQGKVGVQPATRCYADLSAWPEVVEAPTVQAVQDGLLRGDYEAGVVFERLLHEVPDRFDLVSAIGTVCDAWVLYGREPVDEGETVVWRQSPVAQRLGGLAAAGSPHGFGSAVQPAPAAWVR